MTGRILYQLVAPLDLTAGPEEVARRQKFLQANAASGFDVYVQPTKAGRASIESDTDVVLAGPGILDGIVEGAAAGASAAIIGCFGDPALEAVRESVDIPVIAPGESAMTLALHLGYRFSIISPMAEGSARSDARVRQLGLTARYASTRGIGVSVADLAGGKADPLQSIIDVGRRCVEEDGADTLILGCMSMAFLGMTGDIEKAVGVPVVNPVVAALKVAETMLVHKLAHSRSSWPKANIKKSYVRKGE